MAPGLLAAGPLLHPHPSEGRPAWSHGPYGLPASSTQLTVSGTVQYRVVWGINCMCLVIFNTAAPAPDGDHPHLPKWRAAARMDQCMHGTDHTCICMHACPSCLLLPSLFYSLSSTLTLTSQRNLCPGPPLPPLFPWNLSLSVGSWGTFCLVQRMRL